MGHLSPEKRALFSLLKKVGGHRPCRNETEVVLLAGYYSENMLDKTQILTCQKGN
jgi:hypothetical protein